jgi:type I restriction enzyme S subunit
VTDNAIKAVARKDNDPLYLFYLLSTLRLNDRRAGSGQPLLNQQILSNIPVLALQPAEQSAIAAILSSLDDKIELNRRMNETLEASARALFRD